MHLRRTGILTIFTLFAVALPAAGQRTEISKSTVGTSAELTDTTVGPHGGRVFHRDQYTLETLIDPDGIRVYITDTAGQLLDPRGVQGRCLFPRDSGGFSRLQLEVKKDSGKRAPRYRSKPVKKGYYVYFPFDLSLFRDSMIRARIEFSGLPGQTSSVLGFSVPVILTRLCGWACRGHEDRVITKVKNTPLCDKQHLVDVPFLYQCPNHADSRSDRPSKCPLCSSARVPTRQEMRIAPAARKLIFPGKK